MTSPRTSSLQSALADRYRIERELGAGGMATVYLAEDLKHDRKVAIKVLKPELAAVLGAERFVNEIKTTAALSHPHILPLFDSGSAAGQLYYVMPYVEGETIREKLDRETQLGIDEAVRITTEVADALDYAHQRGVIHRDIKPENILLHAGRPRVMDFGIALAVSAAAGGRMTETGLSLGTPHYMSPEQATADKEITGRSDIYSLASVLYEMLTGDPPHTGSSAQQIIMKIVTEEAAPVTKFRRTVPPNVAAALARALEKLPADRFESAKAFAAALTNPHYSGPVVGVTPAAAPWKIRTLVAGAAALVFAALAVWGWSRPTPSTATSSVAWRIPLAIPDSQAPTEDIPAISRDGSTIVYTGARQLYRVLATTGRAEPIPGTRGGRMPTLSPDGRRVAFHRGGALVVQSLDGGGGTELRARIPGAVAWLDDDHLVAPNGNAGMLVVPVNGSPPTPRDSGLVVNAVASLEPGRSVLFTSIETGSDSLESWIGAVDMNGGKPVRLTKGVLARFVEPDRLIVLRDERTIVAFPFDAKRLRITGAEIPVAQGAAFDVAASGRMVYVESQNSTPQSSQTVWVDRRGEVTQLGSEWPGLLTTVAIAPDGRRLAAIVLTPDASRPNEIEVRDVTTGARSRTRSNTYLVDLAWAPDGGSIYYVSALPSRFDILRAAPGSAAEPTQVLRRPGDSAVSAPMPSSDGRTLYFNQGSGNQMIGEIRSVAIDDPAQMRVVAEAHATTPSPSPDGRWLAYKIGANDDTLVVRSTDAMRNEIWVVAPGVRGRARWSKDSRSIHFIARDSMRVATVGGDTDFRIASVQALFRVRGFEMTFDVAPDGRFVMVRVAQPVQAAGEGRRLVMVERAVAGGG